MKKLLTFFVVLFFASLLNAETPEAAKKAETLPPQEQTPPSAQQQTPPVAAEKEKQENAVLKVGTTANYKPFSYIGMSFEPIGFEIDLIEELAKKVGFKYEIKDMSFDKIIPSIQNSSIDMGIAAIDITADRKALVDFTNPYFKTVAVYIKHKSNEDLNDKADLKDKKIGVEKGTSLEKLANSIEGAQVEHFSSSFLGISNLKNKTYDAIIIDLVEASGHLEKNKDLVKFFEEGDGTDGFGIAFAKGKNETLMTKINEALETLKSDGTYDDLLTKYHLK